MTAAVDRPVTPTFVDPEARKRTQETQVMLEETVFFRSLGMGWASIADRLGVQEASLHKAIARAAEAGITIE